MKLIDYDNLKENDYIMMYNGADVYIGRFHMITGRLFPYISGILYYENSSEFSEEWIIRRSISIYRLTDDEIINHILINTI